jgi:hypothetical protein
LHFKCTNSYDTQSNITNIPSGIGLKNVKKRLELIYPNRHKLDIHSEDLMYSVKLDIKLNEKSV